MRICFIRLWIIFSAEGSIIIIHEGATDPDRSRHVITNTRTICDKKLLTIDNEMRCFIHKHILFRKILLMTLKDCLIVALNI